MTRRSLPPVERLRELFDYDPETGHLVRRPRAGDDSLTRRFNTLFAGKPAGQPVRGLVFCWRRWGEVFGPSDHLEDDDR